MSRHWEQVLQVECQHRAIKEDHPVALPGLGLRRLPPLLLPALPDTRAAAGPSRVVVVVAALPVAECEEQHRGDGECEDAAAADDGEDGRLAEPDPPPPRGGGGGRSCCGRARQVVARKCGVSEAEEGRRHGPVEAVVGEVEELERGEPEVRDAAGERVVGEVKRGKAGCKENGPRASWLSEFWCLMINTICGLTSFLVFMFVVHRMQELLGLRN
jgi:hypothetical protein